MSTYVLSLIHICREVTFEMADLVEKTAMTAFSLVKNYKSEKAAKITENEKETVTFFLMRLSVASVVFVSGA